MSARFPCRKFVCGGALGLWESMETPTTFALEYKQGGRLLCFLLKKKIVTVFAGIRFGTNKTSAIRITSCYTLVTSVSARQNPSKTGANSSSRLLSKVSHRSAIPRIASLSSCVTSTRRFFYSVFLSRFFIFICPC